MVIYFIRIFIILQLLAVFVKFQALYYISGESQESCSEGYEQHCLKAEPEVKYRNTGLYVNSIKNYYRLGKIVNGTIQIRRNEFIAQRVNYLLDFMRDFNNGLTYYVSAPASEYDEHGIQFDSRKREDAYKKTKPEENPYSVLLLYKFEGKKRYSFCTGSLLTEEWVLTVSRCLYHEDRPKSYWVYAGGNSLDELHHFLQDDVPLPPTAQLSEAEEIVVHPNYSKREYSYDIGLIKVANKFNMTDTVKTIKLSTKPWDHKGYTTCMTTGFGLVRDIVESKDDLYRKTYRFEAKKPCICSFMVSFHDTLLNGDNTANRFICAKPMQDRGICSGDSGGGLVCEEDGEMMIKGINQRTMDFIDVNYCEANLLLKYFDILLPFHECGDKNMVSMFQDTYFHLPWINKHVKLLSENVTVNIPAASGRIYSSFFTIMLGSCIFSKIFTF